MARMVPAAGAERWWGRIGVGAALFVAACSTTTTVSVDPNANYRWVFGEMPGPMPEVVHSRVDRDDPVIYLGFRMPPRNGHWEFELIASSAWLDALNPDFTHIPSSMVCNGPGCRRGSTPTRPTSPSGTCAARPASRRRTSSARSRHAIRSASAPSSALR